MGWARDADAILAIPQRVRAAYALELRYASMQARLALERLSVQPGAISDSLIDVLEARDAARRARAPRLAGLRRQLALP